MTSERVKKAHYDVKDGQKAQQDLGDGENMASEMANYHLRNGQNGSL